MLAVGEATRLGVRGGLKTLVSQGQSPEGVEAPAIKKMVIRGQKY